MKKTWLFSFSLFIATLVAFYSKTITQQLALNRDSKHSWKTFEKTSDLKVKTHNTTNDELNKARIPIIKREISQQKDQSNAPDINSPLEHSLQKSTFLYRENRVLVGDIQKNDYQNEQIELEMINKPNLKWKDILGNELIRFQNNDTKVMIKEEFSVIKISNSKGQYLEQVVITFLFKDGNLNSFRALIDSESGAVLETWDKTIHEKVLRKRTTFGIPLEDESGIVVR
jgi:hypothetical protein